MFNAKKQEQEIKGIKFDSNGRVCNVDNIDDIYIKLQDVCFSDLPEYYNFTIPLGNNSKYIEELVLDKWLITYNKSENYIITSIIKQKINIPSTFKKDDIENKVWDIEIPGSTSNIGDLEFNHEFTSSLSVKNIFDTMNDNILLEIRNITL